MLLLNLLLAIQCYITVIKLDLVLCNQKYRQVVLYRLIGFRLSPIQIFVWCLVRSKVGRFGHYVIITQDYFSQKNVVFNPKNECSTILLVLWL